MRTNGYLALDKLEEINKCELSVGYSVHSLSPVTNKMIMGRDDIPDWMNIISKTKTPRVQVVLNRCNRYEFWDILKFISTFGSHVRYVQIRRPSTDTRLNELTPDIVAYEEIYTQVSRIFPLRRRLWQDAEIYNIYGMDVCFWRTVKTSVNSMNYFTDGTISDEYFVVEGYLKHVNDSR
jgi:molybdenum cofactor biosynthesis enzyme MoaA